jgi:prefoldin subunit 5
MTNTPIQITTDLKDYLDSFKQTITNRLDELGKGQAEIKERMTALEIGQTEIKGQIGIIDSRLKNLESSSQKIPDLAEKVGELKNWKQIALVVITASLGGLIGWFVRGGSFKP